MRKLMTLTAALIIMTVTPAFAGWSQPIRLSNPGGHATPQILAQGDTLHVVAEDFGPPDRIGYFRSADRGNTWSNLRVLSEDSSQTLFPRIVRDGNRLMALWRNSFYLRGLNIGYAISNNDGISWTSPSYVFPQNRNDLAEYCVSGVNSRINIVFSGPLGDSMAFYALKSTNFGQSWTSPVQITRVLQEGMLDQCAYGNFVHLVWDGRFAWDRTWETQYIKSSNDGLSWSANQVLSLDDRIRSEIPSICVNQLGNICAVWMDGEYSPYIDTGDILGRQSADSGSTWEPEWQASFTHFAWGSDVVSSGDTIHVGWEDEGTGLGRGSIYYTRSADNGATWSDPYWLDGTLDDSADPALAIANGRIYAVWTDSRPNPDTSVCCGLYITRWDPEPDAINDRQDNLPSKAVLSAYPNPFNSSVTITYSNLSYGSNGKGGDIGIYDVQGKLVKTLKTEGGINGKIIWDATDATGEKVSSGIYFARAQYGFEGTRTSQNSIDLKLLYVK